MRRTGATNAPCSSDTTGAPTPGTEWLRPTPDAFGRFVALAVPPTAALGGMFSYRQLKRSFYIWFIQQVGLAEAALLEPGFWEALWADWSPGYDASNDVATCVDT